MSYADLDNLVRGNVKDDAGKLTEADYANGIAAAIKRYSKARPVELCLDLPGTGSADVALPGDWQPSFSTIISVEYPLGGVPESLLTLGDYRLYRSPAGQVLRLVDLAPPLSAAVRVTYTIAHDDSTIPDSDIDTVANLASAYCLLRLAAVYGNATDSTIQADTVSRQSKIDEYRRLADKFEGLFNQALGLSNTDTTVPAMTVAPPQQKNRLTSRYR